MNRHSPRRMRRERLSPGPRLSVEFLEERQLPSGVPLVLQPVPNETADQAPNADLGDLSAAPVVQARGAIGNGPAGAADVAWYQFSLDAPAEVRLTVGGQPGAAAFAGTVSLFNCDPFDFGDPYDLSGNRLLARADAGPGPASLVAGPAAPSASLDRRLASGTYLVAVSGAGNDWFYPYLAGSGVAGQTGAYTLTASATDLGLDPFGTPQLLTADVSPLVVRLDLSAPIDSASTATLTDAGGNPLNVLWTNVSSDGQEFQVAPARSLAPGTYQLTVYDSFGDETLTTMVQVTGGTGGAQDTPATAPDLGDLTRAGLVQAVGEIGDDPYYDATSFDPALNPANAVNLYHFHVSGTGRYAVVAEVFAGRIGSTLDAGVSIFSADPITGRLALVGGNNQTGNNITGTDGSTPLLTDPALSVPLGPGDYWVAVSSGFNTPSPSDGQAPGPDSGIFDPNTTHSGTAGTNTGPYVLNLRAYAVTGAPAVVSASISPGEELAEPPVTLSVRFSAPVNLSQLAVAAFQQTGQGATTAVFIEGTDPATGQPVRYFPRLQSFDSGTNTATFLMLDRLAAGAYTLHLSGANGLTDMLGDPLAGNDSCGDCVIPFCVTAPAPVRSDLGSNNTFGAAQEMGLLFPHELQGTVTLTREPAADASTTHADYYRFQVLQQGQAYFFGLEGPGLPSGAGLTLYDAGGGQIYPPPRLSPPPVLNLHLDAGVYVVRVSWPADASSVGYRLRLRLLGEADNPPPLLSGPAPAVQVRLDAAPAAASAAPPAVAVVVTVSGAPANTASPVAVRGVDLGSAPPSGALLALGDGPVGTSGARPGAAAPSPQVAVELPPAPIPGGGGETTIFTYFEEENPSGGVPVPDALLDFFFGSAASGEGARMGPMLAPLRSVIDALLHGTRRESVPMPLAPIGPPTTATPHEAHAEPRDDTPAADTRSLAVALAAAGLLCPVGRIFNPSERRKDGLKIHPTQKKPSYHAY